MQFDLETVRQRDVGLPSRVVSVVRRGSAQSTSVSVQILLGTRGKPLRCSVTRRRHSHNAGLLFNGRLAEHDPVAVQVYEREVAHSIRPIMQFTQAHVAGTQLRVVSVDSTQLDMSFAAAGV